MLFAQKRISRFNYELLFSYHCAFSSVSYMLVCFTKIFSHNNFALIFTMYVLRRRKVYIACEQEVKCKISKARNVGHD